MAMVLKVAAGPDCDDRRASAYPGQLEQCGDAFDNDCDGRVDEGCGCTEGESVPCYPADPSTVGVGRCRSGFRICSDGALGPCEESRTPVDELCNGVDDDCDGQIDEGVLNACGECGDLASETCDMQDNDCDGRVDEGVLNACGECGLEPDEYCDSVDNDCDGSRRGMSLHRECARVVTRGQRGRKALQHVGLVTGFAQTVSGKLHQSHPTVKSVIL